MFQPTSAPGREGSGPAPAQPSQGPPPPDSGPPAGGPGGAFGGMPTLLLFLLPILLIFFMTRSQNKKQKDLEANLKVGDKVVTRSGLIGRIIDLGDRAKVEIAPGVNVMMLRSAIEGIDGGEAKADDKKAEKKADDKKADDKKDKDK